MKKTRNRRRRVPAHARTEDFGASVTLESETVDELDGLVTARPSNDLDSAPDRGIPSKEEPGHFPLLY